LNGVSQDDVTLSNHGHSRGVLNYNEIAQKKLNEDLINVTNDDNIKRQPVDINQIDYLQSVKSEKSSKFDTKTVLKPKIDGED